MISATKKATRNNARYRRVAPERVRKDQTHRGPAAAQRPMPARAMSDRRRSPWRCGRGGDEVDAGADLGRTGSGRRRVFPGAYIRGIPSGEPRRAWPQPPGALRCPLHRRSGKGSAYKRTTPPAQKNGDAPIRGHEGRQSLQAFVHDILTGSLEKTKDVRAQTNIPIHTKSAHQERPWARRRTGVCVQTSRTSWDPAGIVKSITPKSLSGSMPAGRPSIKTFQPGK